MKKVNLGVVQPFLTVGSLVIPRLLVYAVMISILFSYLVVISIPSGNLPLIEYMTPVTGAGGFEFALVRKHRS